MEIATAGTEMQRDRQKHTEILIEWETVLSDMYFSQLQQHPNEEKITHCD